MRGFSPYLRKIEDSRTMPLVARRKVAETWRDAVGRRAGLRAPSCLARFDQLLGAGLDEGEAAYRVLAEEDLLWVVDEPGSAAPSAGASDEVPAV